MTRTITPKRGWRTAWHAIGRKWVIVGIRDDGEDIRTSIVVAADPETSTIRTMSGSTYRVTGSWPDVGSLPRITPDPTESTP